MNHLIYFFLCFIWVSPWSVILYCRKYSFNKEHRHHESKLWLATSIPKFHFWRLTFSVSADGVCLYHCFSYAAPWIFVRFSVFCELFSFFVCTFHNTLHCCKSSYYLISPANEIKLLHFYTFQEAGFCNNPENIFNYWNELLTQMKSICRSFSRFSFLCTGWINRSLWERPLCVLKTCFQIPQIAVLPSPVEGHLCLGTWHCAVCLPLCLATLFF